MLEKLQDLKRQLQLVKENIASTETEINELVEKNLESKINNKSLSKEIEALTASINALSQSIKVKTIFKDQKQKEETIDKASVNSLKAKISEENLRNQLQTVSLEQQTQELTNKNNEVIKATNEKNEAQKNAQTALLAKANDTNLVSGLKILLAKSAREESAALNLYNQKKQKYACQKLLPEQIIKH